nr:tet_MFS_efflux [uncultured bacterium]
MHFITDNFIVDKVKRERTLRRAFPTVIITATLDAAGLGLVMPVLPALLREMGVGDFGLAFQVGLLTALYAVMQFLFAPVLGRLSDRYGRRRVLLASLLGAAIDYLIMGFASQLWLIYLTRGVAGITGATSAVGASIIADISPPEKRAQRFGWLSACYGGGMILGPVIGGLFGSLSPRIPFFVAAALTGLNLILGLLTLPETGANASKGGAGPTALGRTARGVLAPLVSLLVVFGLVQLIGQAPGSTWVLFTEHRLGWTPFDVGISLSAFGLVQVLVQSTVPGRLVARVGEARTIFIGAGADIAGFVGLAWVNSWIAMIPIMIFLGLGSVSVPALQALLSDRVDEQDQGWLQGILASINSLTSIVGPLVFTSVFALSKNSLDGLLWISAALIYVPVVLILKRSLRSRPTGVTKSGGSGGCDRKNPRGVVP